MGALEGGFLTFVKHAVEHSIIVLLAFTFPALLGVSFLIHKLSARVQVRMGPTFAGPQGIFQSLLDTIKLLQKRVEGRTVVKRIFLLLSFSALFSSLLFIPLSSSWFFFRAQWALIVPVLITLIVAVGLVLIGTIHAEMGGFLGAYRLGTQAIAASLPLLLSVLGVGLRVGGFGWEGVIKAQGVMPYQWLIFSGPFYWLQALVFFFSGPLALSLSPFDSTCFSEEIKAGLSGEFSGLELATFRTIRFYGLFFWSLLTATLFFGGFHLPQTLTDFLANQEHERVISFLELFVLLIKAFALIGVYSWISLVMPKARIDQAAVWSWKTLSFLSLGGTAINIVWLWFRGLI